MIREPSLAALLLSCVPPHNCIQQDLSVHPHQELMQQRALIVGLEVRGIARFLQAEWDGQLLAVVVEYSARFFEVNLPLSSPTFNSPLNTRDKHIPAHHPGSCAAWAGRVSTQTVVGSCAGASHEVL